jgi:hypothetical protein
MKNVILAFGLIGILGIQSCERYNKNPVKIPTPHPLLQKYFSHKPGTTWVYNTEGTSDTSIDYVIEPQNSPRDITQIISEVKPFKFAYSTNSHSGDGVFVQYYDDWYSYGFAFIVENNNFSYPKNKVYNSISDSTGILDSVIVNGVNYKAVLKCIDETSAHFRELWIAPGVGIIKKVQHSNGGTGRTFTLRSFKPVK